MITYDSFSVCHSFGQSVTVITLLHFDLYLKNIAFDGKFYKIQNNYERVFSLSLTLSDSHGCNFVYILAYNAI